MRMCMKCAHVSRAEPDPTACPACGAIYAKVEAAEAAKAAGGPPSQIGDSSPIRITRPGADSSLRAPGSTADPFINRLRRESVYPAFRSVINLGYWFVIGAAIISAGIALFSGNTVVAISAGTSAAIVIVFVHFMREAMLMLADLSDATVRMAARQEQDRA